MSNGQTCGSLTANSVTTPAGVIRPMLFPQTVVNQMFRSGPVTRKWGQVDGRGSGKVVNSPSTVIRPIRLAAYSANHRAPSGPTVIPHGCGPCGSPTGNSVITPAVVIRPILLPHRSVNHRFPSGPEVMSYGHDSAVGTGNSVTAPDVGTIRPMTFSPTNHTFPSGPSTMPRALARAGEGVRNSTIVPEGGLPSADEASGTPGEPSGMTADAASAEPASETGFAGGATMSPADAAGASINGALRSTAAGPASVDGSVIGSYCGGVDQQASSIVTREMSSVTSGSLIICRVPIFPFHSNVEFICAPLPCARYRPSQRTTTHRLYPTTCSGACPSVHRNR